MKYLRQSIFGYIHHTRKQAICQVLNLCSVRSSAFFPNRHLYFHINMTAHTPSTIEQANFRLILSVIVKVMQNTTVTTSSGGGY
ncbi:MAG: hypothetical protein MJ141_02390, partial [Clostridia bacterium]|nr:hypothetical protein [Clostridia bacterium]